MSTTTLRDDCYPGCQVPRVRFVCPEDDVPCDTVSVPVPHRREELAPAGSTHRCQTHGVLLVLA